MVGGGINNHYRHFNKLSAFEESYPEGNNWRCDTGFGPGRLTCYSRMCRLSGMSCTTRSAHKNGSGIIYAHLPAGYTATGGGVYNHYRHWNKHAAFETSIPHGNRSWRCDMGLGHGRFNCYVRGCKATASKRLHCITRTSRSGNWHNVQCPSGYSVTGCGQNEQRRQWNHLSGFEEMRVHGNGCVCDSGFGGGRNQCYTRCCRMQVASAAPSGARYSGRGWCETFHSCKRGDGRNFWAWVKNQGYRRYKGACAHSNGRYGRRHRYWPGKFTYGQCKAKCDRMGGSCQGITMPVNVRQVRL